jgi:hypothetical protein
MHKSVTLLVHARKGFASSTYRASRVIQTVWTFLPMWQPIYSQTYGRQNMEGGDFTQATKRGNKESSVLSRATELLYTAGEIFLLLVL